MSYRGSPTISPNWATTPQLRLSAWRLIAFRRGKVEASGKLLELALEEQRNHEHDDNIAERRGRPARTPSPHPAAV